MWGEVAFAFAPSCFSREAGYIAANHPRPIKQARKSLHQVLIQIISPKVLQQSIAILQLKVYISCGAKIKTHLSGSVVAI